MVESHLMIWSVLQNLLKKKKPPHLWTLFTNPIMGFELIKFIRLILARSGPNYFRNSRFKMHFLSVLLSVFGCSLSWHPFKTDHCSARWSLKSTLVRLLVYS